MNLKFNLFLTILIFEVFNFTDLSAQQYQSIIEGRLLESSTGAPISNANVYISGTTWGNATDKNGYFKISLLPAGIYEIVASSIGYKSETKAITLKTNMTYQAEFKLEDANYELESVVVISHGSDEWKKNYELFKKRFLGESAFSTECIIENPEYINLEWTDANELKAATDRPIIVINNALGYKISCELVNFSWNPTSRKIKFMVRTSFSEIIDTTGMLRETWIKNRSEVYYGSMEQFLKSVITDSISFNGFRVYRALSPSTGKQELLHFDQPFIRPDGDYFDMSFVDFLKIEYIFKDPLHPDVSWIKLLYPQVTLDNFGYPIEPDPFEVYGVWAQKGLANMLPKYFSLRNQF
jgi:hypothetical protein